MLPSLARLPVTPTGAGPEDLPPELVALIQVLVRSDDPCRELVNQCAINKQWAAPCRDGTIYEATNHRMGWYGTHGSLAAVQQHHRDHPDPMWSPATTAREYFLRACAELRQVEVQGPLRYLPQNPNLIDAVCRLMGWYGTYGSLAAVQQHYRDQPDPAWSPPATVQAYASEVVADMLHVHANGLNMMAGALPPNTAHPFFPARPWFAAMASVSIQRNRPHAAEETLSNVPPDNPDYGQIALEAVRKNYMAFYQVDTTRPDYAIIAQAACEADPQILRRVLSVRPDVYYEAARAAVARNGEALRHVEGSLVASSMTLEPVEATNRPLPSLRVLTPAAYVELAIIAVAQNPDALRWVHPGWPGYEAIVIYARRARNVQPRMGL